MEQDIQGDVDPPSTRSAKDTAMFIRSILSIAVVASFVFGAVAEASPQRPTTGLTAQIDGLTAPAPRTGAQTGGLGTTR
ncbi:hypothetical protein [Gymnodinialimonas ceratoperidinii]|uniref:Uncharacterized protein n=1 Tax=Gymnodinialimonas ceratoperidinii TaxID=2856823 RepID=A0A8F6TVV3_9RHOB|nr:hypothetical protein [Gymnodinialimonas ceratoperidinii]QXT38672.1 hypothetical protein KYE46_12085 [Gymnodinialimonas ceratoperidinii]